MGLNKNDLIKIFEKYTEDCSNEYFDAKGIDDSNYDKLANEIIILSSEGNPANSENANCAIFDVNQQRELLVAFREWMRLKHYEESPTNDRIDEFLSNQ